MKRITIDLTEDQASFVEMLLENYLFLTRKAPIGNPQRKFAARILDKLAIHHVS